MRKVFSLVLLLTGVAFGQGVTISPKTTIAANTGVFPGAASGGTSVTINLGQVIVNPSLVDSGNALLMIANQFTTPTPSSGSITVTSLGTFLATPAASNWGLAIYTDSANAPSTLVSGCTSFSSSTPGTPTAALTPGGCTLSAATKYWVAFVTASNTQQQLKAGGAVCDSGLASVFVNTPLGSFTSTASWPGSFGASTTGGECVGDYAVLQYTTTATYTIASGGTALCASGTTCVVDIVPLASGHGLLAGSSAIDLSAVNPLVTSFADSASDTITRRGTCTGTTTISDANCIGSADRGAAGASTLTVNYGGTTVAGVLSYAEVIGTAASSSFDQSEYDTVLLATPFTSGNTGTTGQANELLFGIAVTSLHGGGTFSAGGSWTLLGQSTDLTNLSAATFYRIVSSTGAFNLQGSFSTAGTNNLPALATFK